MSNIKFFAVGRGIALLLCFAFIGAFSSPLAHAAVKPKPVLKTLSSKLTVTKTSFTTVDLAWDAWSGAGNYTVRVRNLDSGTVIQTHSTSATSFSISGLTQGTGYRFEVEKVGYVITEDILM